eukprot:scaffold42219_cov54-Phaeocystis_antarctica.AAC.1
MGPPLFQSFFLSTSYTITRHRLRRCASRRAFSAGRRGGKTRGPPSRVLSSRGRRARPPSSTPGFHKWDPTTGIDTLLCVARPRA